MPLFDIIFISIYFLILLTLGFYGAHRYLMAYLYKKHKNDNPKPLAKFDELPNITIQLPIFNEQYVVERLIEATCNIDYPLDKLQIQVLDDSTDETQDILKKAVQKKADEGFNIVYLHRIDRHGYKAGALEEGLKTATGQFVAVFDADFIPQPSFLKDTVDYFTNEKIGMVQVRWEHLNRDYSLLTKAQSILLDGHFVIEHTARNRSGRFFNFNGTAGIWRKSTIADAGGWQHDTITEDLDLSYRAQSKGWQFIYLIDKTAPAEVPVEMIAFKSQQHRWAKGSIQVAKKLLPTLLKSDLPFKVKLEAFMHLTNNIAYLLMVILSLMMPIAVMMRINRQWTASLLVDIIMFITATLSIASFYMLAQKEVKLDSLPKRLLYLPIVMSIGIGLCINNTKAVLEALVGYKTGFVRTPKYGVINKKQDYRHVKYKFKINWQPWIETALGIYFLWGIINSLMGGNFASIPFLTLFGSGFLYVGLATFLQRSRLLKLAPR